METPHETAPTLSDRQWAAAAHLLALILALVTSWAAGIAGAVGALAIWIIKRDDSPFAAEHAREALNFNLSMFIYAVVLVVLSVVTLGIGLIFTVPVGLLIALVWLVCTLIAAFRAYDGQPYRYPISIRLFR
ncbi:DUF4870 domain-containing protein [Vulcaniibacterium gelatinicum]|uniref:DUF4870 domain-containing protein n=1 Tax=Vulcaniibacterium gelatinicum TaxID=2598725 RepID=UPI0011C75192|nr:DUF4870 domain-containing protein [Vulcaniibacterium gelatinicum]